MSSSCIRITALISGCVFTVAALGTLITGPILMVNGQDKLDEVNNADPDKDFRDLGKACNVTGVKHCWSTDTRTIYNHCRNNNKYDCYDKPAAMPTVQEVAPVVAQV